MPKRNFTLAWVLPCKFAVYFQKNFSKKTPLVRGFMFQLGRAKYELSVDEMQVPLLKCRIKKTIQGAFTLSFIRISINC